MSLQTPLNELRQELERHGILAHFLKLKGLEVQGLLERIVETAHANDQRVRFWATPDEAGTAREALWQVLSEVGVDHINTDDLAGLETFLRERSDAASAQ